MNQLFRLIIPWLILSGLNASGQVTDTVVSFFIVIKDSAFSSVEEARSGVPVFKDPDVQAIIEQYDITEFSV